MYNSPLLEFATRLFKKGCSYKFTPDKHGADQRKKILFETFVN